MNPKRWQRIKTILADAREQPRTGRADWLTKVCGGDHGLQVEVEAFLAHEDGLEGFIDQPVLALTVDAEHDLSDPRLQDVARASGMIGGQIGPYRLLGLLGEGGMGAVFLAERIEGFEQRVALKLVRPGLANATTVRRFEEERQILARLEHPNIARLLDGGTSDDGAPFFAMELIEGVSIDRFCDQNRLTTRERVDLFLPVCAALAAAHQSLVIHRDLKPGNILVNATGDPKLLDFGIARLLTLDAGGESGAQIDVTRHQIMTPRYASPEQLRNEAVGTASDVYALGVVLYQVLTGHLPCRLDELDPVATLLAVCQEVPLAASVVVRRDVSGTGSEDETTSRTPTALSELRDGDVRTLRKRLSGDLDSILAKALRKDPRDRYRSVEQMAADLRRHREGLPVLARQGDLRYRAGKFVGRHRFGLATAAVLVLLVLGFTAALARQLNATESARDQAVEISTFLIELFQAAAPDRLVGQEATVRDLLDRGRGKLEAGFDQAPEVRATLLLRLGEVYGKLGDYAEATGLLTEAIAIQRSLKFGDHPELATALGDLAVVRYRAGDAESAEAHCRESLAMRQRLGDGDDLIKPRNTLATILLDRDKPVEAAAIYRHGLSLRRAAVAVSPTDPSALDNLATSLRNLATAVVMMGDLDQADALLHEALAIREQLFGADSTKVASVWISLGRLEQARGRLAEAEALIVRARDVRRAHLGDEHLHTALAQSDLGAVRAARGEWLDAEGPAASAVRSLRRSRSPGDRRLAVAEGILGTVLVGQERYRDAEDHLRRSCATLRRKKVHAARAMAPCQVLRALQDTIGALDSVSPTGVE